MSLAETMETGDTYRDVTYNIDSRDVKLFRNWLVYEFYHLKAWLCSSRALWPLAPNFYFFFSWVTRKSYFLHTGHMLGTLDFTGPELWALFNFP